MNIIFGNNRYKVNSNKSRLNLNEENLFENIRKHKGLYLFLVPCIAYYFVFWLVPLYGIQIAFKDFNPVLGISKSTFVGLKYFRDFFTYYETPRYIYNTVAISSFKILFGFPAPILLAIIINEIKNVYYKKTVQTISYLPHFISWAVISNIIYKLLAVDGIVNDFMADFLGFERQIFMVNTKIFWPLIIMTDIWKEVGFGSIVYLAALSAIDEQLYEASRIDGAGRIRQIFNITLPGIMPTIVVMFIMRVGSIMHAGFEQIWTLRNGAVSEVTDILEVYTMIMGVQRGQFSYGAAVGLFTGVVSAIFMILANSIAKRYKEISIW